MPRRTVYNLPEPKFKPKVILYTSNVLVFCYYTSLPKELNHISAKIRNDTLGIDRYLLIQTHGSNHCCQNHEQFARQSYFHGVPGAPVSHLSCPCRPHLCNNELSCILVLGQIIKQEMTTYTCLPL